MATKKTKKVQYLGTGRRKTAIARVRLIPGGEAVWYTTIISEAGSLVMSLYFLRRYREAQS